MNKESSEEFKSNIDFTKINYPGMNVIAERMEEISALATESLRGFSNVTDMIAEKMFKIEDVYETLYKPVIENLNNMFKKFDFNKIWINIYKVFLMENKAFIDKLVDETIFPPINYMIEEEILEKGIIGDLYDFIYSDELKEYYLNEIEGWKNKYKDEAVKKMINDIKTSFKSDSYYSVCFLVFPLIERMLRENIFEEEGSVHYSDIKKVLKTEVFDVIEDDKMYKVFIEKNLYCDTKKAEEFSRHIAHGVKLDLVNKKVAMNMVFIYDFIQSILI